MLGEHGSGMIHLEERSKQGAMMNDMQYRFGGALEGRLLDRCVWVYTEPIHFDQSGALSTRSTVAQNVIAMFPLRDRFDSLLHQSTNEEVRTHINDYRSLMQESKALIEDSSIRFAFIHLPVPHPPGIYD